MYVCKTHNRRRQSARRHFRNGRRSATVRATTGAQLYINGSAPSIAAAAEATGSCTTYVKAATVLWRSENSQLLDDVWAGRVPLLKAARQARRVADLVCAYRHAQPEDLAAATHMIGTETLFANMLEPALA